MQHRCLICADLVAPGELFQHATGDYHTVCFGSIAAAAVKVEQWNGDPARCRLCNDSIAPRAVVVTPGEVVVHLRCFFDPPTAGRRSLGGGVDADAERAQYRAGPVVAGAALAIGPSDGARTRAMRMASVDTIGDAGARSDEESVSAAGVPPFSSRGLAVAGRRRGIHPR